MACFSGLTAAMVTTTLASACGSPTVNNVSRVAWRLAPLKLGGIIDHGGSLETQPMRALEILAIYVTPFLLIGTNAADPLRDETGILARCHAAVRTAMAGELELAGPLAGDL